MNPVNLKYISLVTLTVQNSVVSLSMRYARTRDGDIFFSSTGEIFTYILCCSEKHRKEVALDVAIMN